MVSACVLYCSVCDNTFETRKEWLNHLLQPTHQNLARVDCFSWDLKVKECVLVAFATCDIAREDLLQLFSLRDRNTIITDFIWSEHRPRVGIIQFESRHKAEEVLEESRRNEVLIDDNQLIRLRKATDFMDVEWTELLEKFHCEGKDFVHQKNCSPTLDVDTTLESLSFASFSKQFLAICDEVEIPGNEFNLALDIMEKCRQIFVSRFPSCKLYMFRHWYLKLRNQGTNELLFYLDANGQIENNASAAVGNHIQAYFLSAADVEKFLSSPSAQQILPGVRRFQSKKPNRESRAHQFQHEPTGLEFSIVTDALFVTEVQTCRLVKYLMEFDPRVRPFFVLIFYWAKKNAIAMSTPVYKDPVKSHAFAPEPAGLEWMIITFLAHKGIIPKPWQILQEPHTKLILFKRVDIGFSTDSNFPNKWAETPSSTSTCPDPNSLQFFINILELMKEFFTFYGKLKDSAWIVNTRDAEVIAKHNFFHKKPHVEWETRLTLDEIANLKFVSLKSSLTQVDLNSRIYSILHPLYMEWCISFYGDRFCSEICMKMILSAELLEKSLKEGKTQGVSWPPLNTMIQWVRVNTFRPNYSTVKKPAVKRRKKDEPNDSD